MTKNVKVEIRLLAAKKSIIIFEVIKSVFISIPTVMSFLQYMLFVIDVKTGAKIGGQFFRGWESGGGVYACVSARVYYRAQNTDRNQFPRKTEMNIKKLSDFFF